MCKLLLLCILLVGAGTARVGAQGLAANGQGKMIVHEWGTFLSVQGSDGVSLGGMIDSEEELPVFVRERDLDGRNRSCFFLKMETPVTYFYVDQPRTVQVKVGMPGGLLTHWYPAVRTFGPPIPPGDKKARPKTAVGGSFLDWGKVELIPDYRTLGFSLLPPSFKVVDEKSTWRFARETDSAFVKMAKDNPRVHPGSTGEWEKFLFYRGLGTFDLPLQVRASGPGEDVRLALSNRGGDALEGIFAVQVEKGSIRFAALPDLPGGASGEAVLASALSAPLPLKDGVGPAKQAVETALLKAGLYAKEARAMVNTWEKSYFRTEGLRMLYVLPRATTDETIPVQIKPAPDQLVRVMVGRVEVLTPATEARIEKAVADLGAANAAARQAAEVELTRLGRLKEPVLHRIEARTEVPQVREQARALIRLGQRGK
jgi:hypothetical protein